MPHQLSATSLSAERACENTNYGGKHGAKENHVINDSRTERLCLPPVFSFTLFSDLI